VPCFEADDSTVGAEQADEEKVVVGDVPESKQLASSMRPSGMHLISMELRIAVLDVMSSLDQLSLVLLHDRSSSILLLQRVQAV
jgi:hypothetical protein